MKICAISDSHRRRPTGIPEADILIHAGDIGGAGNVDEIRTELKWLESLKPRFPKGIIFVPGNHDKALDPDVYAKRLRAWERDPYHTYRPDSLKVKAETLRDEFNMAGITMLIDEAIDIDGFKLYGSPYTPIFFDWAFMENEADLGRRFATIPEDTDILITHGPAQGIRDFCSNGHVGSSALRWVVDNKLPELKVHIFGHIHEGAGLGMVKRPAGEYLAWNAAVLDGNYQGFNNVHTIELTSEPAPASEQIAGT